MFVTCFFFRCYIDFCIPWKATIGLCFTWFSVNYVLLLIRSGACSSVSFIYWLNLVWLMLTKKLIFLK